MLFTFRLKVSPDIRRYGAFRLLTLFLAGAKRRIVREGASETPGRY